MPTPDFQMSPEEYEASKPKDIDKKVVTIPLYDTEQYGLIWKDGAPPEEWSDGRLALVILKRSATDKYLTEGGSFEYYGKPVIVSCWGHKMKTTVNPIRINPDDVERWHPFPVK